MDKTAEINYTNLLKNEKHEFSHFLKEVCSLSELRKMKVEDIIKLEMTDDRDYLHEKQLEKII